MLVSELSKQFIDITNEDINRILQTTMKENNGNMSMLFLDVNYMYNFHLDDFEHVRKFNLLGRYFANRLKELEPKSSQYQQALVDNSKYCREWHRALELWHDDRYVTLGNNQIKPIKISRQFDRVVNEGMERVAAFICGSENTNTFDCRGIGDGEGEEASVADNDLTHVVDLINVNSAPEGGSLSRDGTTIYSVGNHSKEVETPDNGEFTECGMFDETDDNRHMLDHSVFEDPIEHTQHADAPGSTTVIYICSG